MSKKVTLLICLLMVGAGWTQAAPFNDHGNGTLTDQNTGIMWLKDTDSTQKSWQTALDYCNNLTMASYEDWRLPDIKELDSIIDEASQAPVVDPVFSNLKGDFYWSSTTGLNHSVAWSLSFANAQMLSLHKETMKYVLCVR